MLLLGTIVLTFSYVSRPDQPADKQVDVDESSLVVKGDKSAKEAKDAEEAAKQAASQAANQESLKVALGRLTKESLAKGHPMFEKSWAKFQEAIDMLPEDEKNKPLKPQQVPPTTTTSSPNSAIPHFAYSGMA
jgi:hypothetical protein